MYVSISKVVKSVLSIVHYVMDRKEAVLIYSSIPDRDGCITKNFDEIVSFLEEQQKTNFKNSLGHLIISSADPSMKIEEEERWNAVFLRAVDLMGLSHSPRIVALHNDRSTPHGHSLLSYFKVEYCLGEDTFGWDKFTKKSKSEFDKHYKKMQKKLQAKGKATARQIEDEFGLQRDCVKVFIGKDRYIDPKYSIKHHLSLAYEQALEISFSLYEFVSNLKEACQEKISELLDRVKANNKRSVTPLVGNDPSIKVDVQKAGAKIKNDRILVSVGNFKISDYKIAEGLDFKSVLNILKRNANLVVNFVRPVVTDFTSRIGSMGFSLGLSLGLTNREDPALIEKSQEQYSKSTFEINESIDHRMGFMNRVLMAMGMLEHHETETELAAEREVDDKKKLLIELRNQAGQNSTRDNLTDPPMTVNVPNEPKKPVPVHTANRIPVVRKIVEALIPKIGSKVAYERISQLEENLGRYPKGTIRREIAELQLQEAERWANLNMKERIIENIQAMKVRVIKWISSESKKLVNSFMAQWNKPKKPTVAELKQMELAYERARSMEKQAAYDRYCAELLRLNKPVYQPRQVSKGYEPYAERTEIHQKKMGISL